MGGEELKPVILVTRYPDDPTEVIPIGFDEEPQVIILDFGAGFTIGSIEEGEVGEVLDWVEFHQKEVEGLDPDHPARITVEYAINEVLSECRSRGYDVPYTGEEGLDVPFA